MNKFCKIMIYTDRSRLTIIGHEMLISSQKGKSCVFGDTYQDLHLLAWELLVMVVNNLIIIKI